MEGADEMVIKDLDTGKKYVLDGAGSLENETGQKVVLEQFKAEVRARPGGTSMDMGLIASSSDEGTPRSLHSGHPPRLERTLGFRVPKRLKEGIAKMKSLESQQNTSIPSVMTSLPTTHSGAQGSEESLSSSSMVPIPHSPLSWNDSSSTTTSHTRSESMKVTVNRRRNKEMSDVRMVQEMQGHEGVIWIMKFSPDGEYLATGGKDASILLWVVVSKRGQDKDNAFQTELPVFDSQPCRTWHGHTADVLDIAWSAASELVLSASLDKTVRLWTVSQDACLREIPHQTWVTSVRFHPQDPSKFISGCGDGVLRLWDLMARKVIGSASIAGEKDLYTALSFNEDGKMILAGSYKGKCRLYQIIDRKIEIKAEIDVRNRRGRHARGRKVTGVEFSSVDGQPRFLVTTSDSRIRMLQGTTSAPSEVAKFKGHMNESGRPVGASTSPRGDYVICGSDDGRVFVWPFNQGDASSSPRGYKSVSSREKVASFETFRAHSGYTTSAIFAPDTCRRPFGFLDSEQEQVDSATPPARVRMQHMLFQCQGTNGSGDYKGIKLWGQVIVTAGQGGEIRIWENFGLPVSNCS